MIGILSQRRVPGASLLALTVSAVCVAAASASAQESTATAPSPPTIVTHLDLTLDTGSFPAPTVPTKTDTPSANQRNQPELGSRSATVSRESFREMPTAAPQVLAQLGSVTGSVAQIRVARDTHSRLLSTVTKGTNLAVVADGGAYWGVLMVNNTMGWTPKTGLQLMEYRASVAAPTTSVADTPPAVSSPAQSAAASVVSSVAQSASDMGPRTTALLREAFSYLGVPYVWAGNTRRGLDCSGFVCNVFGAMGVHLPRHSGDQALVGQSVRGDDLQPGDRLYFDMGNRGEISHCGIYVGNGYFIHASTNHGRVDVDSLLKPNYRKALVRACRS